ncbi:MAG TPA: hypothetical protein VMG08_12590 [Allosphingosinicella sp.]|nr:hypothetical protein [Allosphingosinicella sp.]
MAGPGGNYAQMAAATQGSGWGVCIMSLDGDGQLWCTTQQGEGGPWNAAQGPKFNGQPGPASAIALSDQGNGLLMLAMLDKEGMTWTLAQTAANVWADEWTPPPIGVQIIGFSAIAANANYTYGLQLMAADEMGQIWNCYQLTPGGEWGGWIALGAGTQPVTAYELALAMQNNNQQMLVAEGGGQVATCPEVSTGETWGPWSEANVNNQPEPLTGICACQQGGGRGIQIWGLEDSDNAGGTLWTLYQNTAGGQWDPWQGFTTNQPALFVAIVAAQQYDGTCLFVGVAEDGNPWMINQTSPGGDWGDWYQPVPTS